MSHLKRIYQSGITGLLTLAVLLTTAFSGLAGTLGSISLEMSNSNITIHVYQIGTLAAKNNQWQFTQNNVFAPIAFSLDDLDEINGIAAKRAKAAELAAFAIDNKVPVYQKGVSDVYGSLTFSDIEEGVYLIVKTNDTAVNVTIEPFFVTMPTQKLDHTGYEWNVTCKPKYEFDILDLNIWAKKVLVGRSLAEGEFHFQLTQVYSSNGDVKATLTAANDVNGNIVFSALSFDKKGTYVFQLSELAGSDSSVTYDTGKYYVKVEITKNQAGGLTRTVTCGKEYNSSTHQLSGMVDLSQEYPRFENIIISSGGSSGGGGSGISSGSSSSTTLGSGSTTVVTLPDGGVPLGDYYIEDPPVPLTGLPQTGDNAVSALVLSFLIGASIGGLVFLLCKKSPRN